LRDILESVAFLKKERLLEMQCYLRVYGICQQGYPFHGAFNGANEVYMIQIQNIQNIGRQELGAAQEPFHLR
jgi:hypothetical protein